MSSAPVLLSHRSSLDHDTGDHPERIARIEAINSLLERRDWLGYERVESPPVERDVLERVHPAAHVDAIARASELGGLQLDTDTFVSAGSYTAALHSCGGAVDLVRRLLDGGPGQVGFSVHRPPGHHALPSRAMGFCLFNNIAVAARHALAAPGIERVLILDWDIHHGNGTNDIFWDSDEVLFISIHQSPLYPGSGRESELGGGAGYGYTINLPVPPGSGDETFVSLVRDVALPVARSHRPQLVLVSAGYDAHRDDPLAGCAVTDAGFQAMTALVRNLGAELETPVGCVLEGGYDVNALARCVALTMETLASGGRAGSNPDAETSPIPVHRLATVALERLVPLWPALRP
ncbi:MAG TPA: histone deacetylase [Solirubrobacteraceae bacterium]|nr:histone deacetylase [Solirubrobacteraceae bacterium]